MLHTIEHVFEASAERLWQVVFFDDAYARGLAERLRVRVDDSELHHEGAGRTLLVRRRVRMTPQRELPALFGRLFGPDRSVTESGDFSAERRRYSVRVELPALRGKVRCAGEYTWDTLPGGELQRVWQGRCEARIPLVGAAVERYLLGEIENSLAEAYAFTRRWLREHPEPASLAEHQATGEAAADQALRGLGEAGDLVGLAGVAGGGLDPTEQLAVGGEQRVAGRGELGGQAVREDR